MKKKETRINQEGVTVMTTKVQKWGNSLAIRIPKSVAEKIHIVQGTEIELHVEDNILKVKPKNNRSTLEELLSRVTEENRHTEIDFGTEGNESF